MHKFMFLKAIKITMPRTNAKTPLKIYFLNGMATFGEWKKAAVWARYKLGNNKKIAQIEVNGKDWVKQLWMQVSVRVFAYALNRNVYTIHTIQPSAKQNGIF